MACAEDCTWCDKSDGYEVFMRRERRRLQARHIWEKIEPNWSVIRARVWTKQATGLPYDALHRRLFLHDHGRIQVVGKLQYRGPHWRWVQQQWKNCQAWFAGQAVRRVNGSVLCTSIGLISSTLCHGNGSINMRI